MRVALLLVALWVSAACADTHAVAPKPPHPAPKPVVADTHPAAQKVLSTLKRMVAQGEIIRGGCWNYIDAAYTRAGFPRAKRQRVFHGSKSRGPYAPVAMIHAGDWLYYINHSYGDIEHSGVFIRWVDRPKKIALILSYAGEQRREPGRYKEYELSNVYVIVRPKL